MVPTGGVSLTTAGDFIKVGAAALGVGTDLVDVKAIREGNAHIVTDVHDSSSTLYVRHGRKTFKTAWG